MKLTATQMRLHLFIVLTVFLCTRYNANAQTSLNLNIGKDTVLPLKQSSPTQLTLIAKTDLVPLAYSWTQLSGNSVDLAATNLSTLTLNNLQVGTYRFRCEVTGASGTDADDILVKVVNFQDKGKAPCRTGPPVVWTLSATNSTDLYRPYLRRSGFDIQGGDTIKINANPNNGGVYNRIYLGEFGGSEGCPVVVVPNNQVVKIGGTGARWFLGTNIGIADSNFVNHVVIDGTYLRNKTGDQYGFQSTGTGFGMGTRLITDLEVKGCLFKDNSLGIQIKILSDSAYPWTVYDNFRIKNIKINDNYFQNMAGSEGLYIGSTDPSGETQAGNHGPVPRLDSVFIFNNFFNGTAWDPIQTSAARYSEIHDNIILNGSVVNQSSQNWGILMGANCTGKIYNNVMYNGKGGTVGSLGYGFTEIYYNFIDSTKGGNGTSDGIYVDMKNARILESSLPGMFPRMQINIRDNIVSRFERNAIFHADNENTSNPGVIRNNYIVEPTRSLSQVVRSNGNDVISNNTLVPSFPVTIRDIGTYTSGPRVHVTQGAASDTFSKAKDIIDWLFSRLNASPTPPPANTPPVANAGNDITITLPVNSTTLTGSGTDNNGSITSYAWTKIAGPTQFMIMNAAGAQTTVTNLVQGVYQFRLTVTDNNGATDSDTVNVTVNAALPSTNQPPVANAGNDITITLPLNSITLMGSGTDTDGTITSYLWTKVAGPTQFMIMNAAGAQTTVNNLVQGVYQFRLTVTDDDGATSTDLVVVTVNAAPPSSNQPPVANAGNDISITLPTSSVTLMGSGTDADGNITNYSWTKIAGPTQFMIMNAAGAQTTVNNLVQGVYQFRLTVTDDDGLTGTDIVIVTVNAAPPATNQLPLVNAGNDITITLPVNTVTLVGTANDPDGSIANYTWTKISGPLFSTIQSPGQAQTQVSFALPGTYEFSLRVTDNQGATATDQVRVTVKDNMAPEANAGEDKEIEWPTDSIWLQGSGTDPDGLVTGYEWKLISGPSQFFINNPYSAHTKVDQLTLGTYIFELRITDNNGATDTDTMQLSVKNIPLSKATVYPNPVSSTLNIRIDANTHNNLTLVVIYDVSGKAIYKEQFLRTEFSVVKPIDVSHLIPGTYFVNIEADINRSVGLKFIKQ